jgi:hypothetical protein
MYNKQLMLWREKHLLEILEAGKLNTTKVVERANMSKATALKYLEGLKGRELIKCEMIGPTKLWSLAREKEVKVKSEEMTLTQFEEKKVEEDFENPPETSEYPPKVYEGGNGKRSKSKYSEEYISIDKSIFKLFDEFESDTGKSFEILINKTGIKIQLTGSRA